MKITAEHFNHISTAISDAFSAADVDKHREFIIKEGRAKDIEKRLRWDLLYHTPGLSQYLSDNLYAYMDDSHVDTALKAVMRKHYHI